MFYFVTGREGKNDGIESTSCAIDINIYKKAEETARYCVSMRYCRASSREHILTKRRKEIYLLRVTLILRQSSLYYRRREQIHLFARNIRNGVNINQRLLGLHADAI